MYLLVGGLEYSSIVGNSQHFLTWLSKLLEPVTRSSSYWNRCYRATVNGWSSYNFHSCCDGKGPSVTIIRVGKYIFGGYTSYSWSKSPPSRPHPKHYVVYVRIFIRQKLLKCAIYIYIYIYIYIDI